MKKSHFTDEQIAFCLRQVESGVPVDMAHCSVPFATIDEYGDSRSLTEIVKPQKAILEEIWLKVEAEKECHFRRSAVEQLTGVFMSQDAVYTQRRSCRWP